ncbi:MULTISPECIES: glycosyltransferase family 2 protein [unclassified Ruegeria]|uniref:glycosyltransferase family 2 protein n=1 Tax=unclassified Ruegeria TaxID=2625375 RepID=UPI001487EA99|nr:MULTISPECIES: glycosyltransferase family 2 protein [unclassified Ruegeria]
MMQSSENCAEVEALAPPANDVFVAIPTLNEEQNIENCIRQLLDGDPWMAGVCLIVADGGSTDRTCTIVDRLRDEYPNLRLVNNSRRLQSSAVNLVAEFAEAEGARFLVRCDAHAIYPSGFVRRVVSKLALMPEDTAAIAVVMDAVGENAFQRSLSTIVDTRIGSGGAHHRGGNFSGYVDHGHHAGFALRWFRAVGGYDDTFSHNEDAELDARFAKANGLIWMESSIRLKYVVRNSLNKLARQYFNYGAGRARNIMKHGTRLKVRQVLPLLCATLLLACILVSAFWSVAIAPVIAYLGVLLALSLIFACKLKSPAGLWTGPIVFIIHNAWAVGYIYAFVCAQIHKSGQVATQ